MLASLPISRALGCFTSDYLSLGGTNTRPARTTISVATSLFSTRKFVDHSHHRLIKKLFRHSPSPLSSLCFLVASLNSHTTITTARYSSTLNTTKHHNLSQLYSALSHNYSKLLKLHHTTNMPAQRPSQLPPCPGPPPSRPLAPLPKQG